MTNNDDLPSLEELDKSIKKAKEKALNNESGKSSSGGAFRTSVDLLSGVLVGSLVGYWLDKLFGTIPLFFIICFFLGVTGSALNIYRSVQKDNEPNE